MELLLLQRLRQVSMTGPFLIDNQKLIIFTITGTKEQLLWVWSWMEPQILTLSGPTVASVQDWDLLRVMLCRHCFMSQVCSLAVLKSLITSSAWLFFSCLLCRTSAEQVFFHHKTVFFSGARVYYYFLILCSCYISLDRTCGSWPCCITLEIEQEANALAASFLCQC